MKSLRKRMKPYIIWLTIGLQAFTGFGVKPVYAEKIDDNCVKKTSKYIDKLGHNIIETECRDREGNLVTSFLEGDINRDLKVDYTVKNFYDSQGNLTKKIQKSLGSSKRVWEHSYYQDNEYNNVEKILMDQNGDGSHETILIEVTDRENRHMLLKKLVGGISEQGFISKGEINLYNEQGIISTEYIKDGRLMNKNSNINNPNISYDTNMTVF